MNKLKITFFISLLIVLIISIGSISAQNIDSEDCQVLDDNYDEDLSLNDDILDDSNQNENILNNAELNEDSLENNDLNDEISTDEEIESIKRG